MLSLWSYAWISFLSYNKSQTTKKRLWQVSTQPVVLFFLVLFVDLWSVREIIATACWSCCMWTDGALKKSRPWQRWWKGSNRGRLKFKQPRFMDEKWWKNMLHVKTCLFLGWWQFWNGHIGWFARWYHQIPVVKWLRLSGQSEHWQNRLSLGVVPNKWELWQAYLAAC